MKIPEQINLYSVIRSPGNDRKAKHVIAEHLPLAEARALAEKLDYDYRHHITSTGGLYSSWSADLHYIKLEPSA